MDRKLNIIVRDDITQITSGTNMHFLVKSRARLSFFIMFETPETLIAQPTSNDQEWHTLSLLCLTFQQRMNESKLCYKTLDHKSLNREATSWIGYWKPKHTHFVFLSHFAFSNKTLRKGGKEIH